jgi:hypothetical protein
VRDDLLSRGLDPATSHREGGTAVMTVEDIVASNLAAVLVTWAG